MMAMRSSDHAFTLERQSEYYKSIAWKTYEVMYQLARANLISPFAVQKVQKLNFQGLELRGACPLSL
jgi:hypothetical protein